MMAPTQRFVFAALAALALSMSVATFAVEASTLSASPSQPQRMSAAEGTFVRGLMAADHQFGLYDMTVGETSTRGGGVGEEEAAAKDGRSGGPMMEVHQAVDNARHRAVNFAHVVRRKAFSPVHSRRQSRQ